MLNAISNLFLALSSLVAAGEGTLASPIRTSGQFNQYRRIVLFISTVSKRKEEVDRIRHAFAPPGYAVAELDGVR